MEWHTNVCVWYCFVESSHRIVAVGGGGGDSTLVGWNACKLITPFKPTDRLGFGDVFLSHYHRNEKRNHYLSCVSCGNGGGSGCYQSETEKE